MGEFFIQKKKSGSGEVIAGMNQGPLGTVIQGGRAHESKGAPCSNYSLSAEQALLSQCRDKAHEKQGRE